jgi:predicted HicB family RNase H-like nuclease
MAEIVEEELSAMAECEQAPPPSLTDHLYSGTFLVRTSPTLHARLTVEATEQGVSLNQWSSPNSPTASGPSASAISSISPATSRDG